MTVERISPADLARLRVDKGWTAITIEIVPHSPVTAIIRDADVDRGLHTLEKGFEHVPVLDRADPACYAGIRREMANQLVPAIARLDKDVIEHCALVALWCALNHPRDGGLMRARMEHFRKEGLTSHLTMCRGTGGTYVTALGDGYVDLRAHAERRVPRGDAIVGLA